MTRSTLRLFWGLTLFGLLSPPAWSGVVMPLGAGYAIGTLQAGETVAISMFPFHAGLEFSLEVGKSSQISLTPIFRYALVSYTVAGVSKSGDYKSGGVGLGFASGEDSQLGLTFFYYPYGQLLVASDSKSSINGEEVRNVAFDKYTGTAAGAVYIVWNFFKTDGGFSKIHKFRNSFMIGAASQQFSSRTQRVVTTRPSTAKLDTRETSEETTPLIYLTAAIEMAVSF